MRGLSRSMVVALLFAWVSVHGGAPAQAGDVYDNQINMTLNLMRTTQQSFGEACLRLHGTLTEGDNMSRCERGEMLLAITLADDKVTMAMIAYPANPKDIRGLWKKAREVFGEPHVATEKELRWGFENGSVATAGYDDKHSAFIFAQR